MNDDDGSDGRETVMYSMNLMSAHSRVVLE